MISIKEYGHQDIIFVGKSHTFVGDGYDKDLRNVESDEFNIVQVYDRKTSNLLGCDTDTKLLWERPGTIGVPFITVNGIDYSKGMVISIIRNHKKL